MPATFWTHYAIAVVTIGVLLALIYAGARAVRGRNARTDVARSVVILETAALSPHATLHVIRTGGRRLLVGSTTHAIQVLAALSADGGLEVRELSDLTRSRERDVN